jgi:uncharacterized membrane-anchored protein
MTTLFSYVPSTGDLSGVSFEEQTESAFNELGRFIDEGRADADEALALAQQAHQTASDAQAQADIAQATAVAAQTLAAQAAQDSASATATANQAYSAANEARATAASANSAATDAQTQAGAAASAASEAKDTAQQASSDATTATTTANVALAAANSAITIANGASVYQVTDGSVDANTLYAKAQLYLTNSASANLPPGIIMPVWLDVVVNDQGSGAMQTLWDTDTEYVWTRQATINASDPANPVVTWSLWQSVAVPQTLTGVEVVTDPAGQPAGTYLALTWDTSAGSATTYIDVTTLAPVYTAGNAGITVSADGRISAQTSATADNGVSVDPTGIYASKASIGLGNVDNTSDVNKPVSAAQQAALDGKADTSSAYQSDGIKYDSASGFDFNQDPTNVDCALYFDVTYPGFNILNVPEYIERANIELPTPGNQTWLIYYRYTSEEAAVQYAFLASTNPVLLMRGIGYADGSWHFGLWKTILAGGYSDEPVKLFLRLQRLLGPDIGGSADDVAGFACLQFENTVLGNSGQEVSSNIAMMTRQAGSVRLGAFPRNPANPQDDLVWNLQFFDKAGAVSNSFFHAGGRIETDAYGYLEDYFMPRVAEDAGSSVAVGAYVFAVNNTGGNVARGSVVAGSALTPCGVKPTGALDISVALGGSWYSHGYAGNGSATLFRRLA